MLGSVNHFCSLLLLPFSFLPLTSWDFQPLTPSLLCMKRICVCTQQPSPVSASNSEAQASRHMGPCPAEVDFCVSLGGDGTVLHLTSLFTEDEPLPPVISFSMGTLGFLTPFDAGDFQPCLSRVLAANQDPVFCTLRTRKRCEVYW